MAPRFYRISHVQNGREHLDSVVMDEVEAYEVMGITRMLHEAFGFETGVCPCGRGYAATRGDVHRVEHLVPVDADELQDALMARVREVM